MMEAIGAWLVTVAGSTVLFGLFDMLLPSGSVRSFTRAVMGLVMMAIMLSPLLNWRGGAVDWPVDVQSWLGARNGAAPRVDWNEVEALQEAGRRAAIREAKARWERELSQRLTEPEAVARASVSSVWGDGGPREVRARLWVAGVSSGSPSAGVAGVENPFALSPVGREGDVERRAAPGAGDGRAPPATGGDESVGTGETREEDRSEAMEARARRVVQSFSALPIERIHVQLVEEG